MRLFIFTFIIFQLGWWSSYICNYLYMKKYNKIIREEIADNHDYYFFVENNKDIALGLEYALDIFEDYDIFNDYQKGGK